MDTAALIEELALGQSRIRGIRLRRRFGKSAALAAGFDHARGTTIVTIDGDGQDDPADIPAFSRHWATARIWSAAGSATAAIHSPAGQPPGSSTG